MRGGLGYVTIMAACLLAALSGAAVADTAALLLPMMVKAGHDKARAGGLIASAGIIAPIIPPSIGFVIFGVAANVSISKLFLAGTVPGLLMGVAIAGTWWRVARKEGVTPPKKATRAEKLAALRQSTWALVLPAIVLVGPKMGVFTPTEAAVVAAAVYAFQGGEGARCAQSQSPHSERAQAALNTMLQPNDLPLLGLPLFTPSPSSACRRAGSTINTAFAPT